MKKLVIAIIVSVFCSSCYNHYNIITEESFNQTGASSVNFVENNGYKLDTVIEEHFVNEFGYIQHYESLYSFTNENDTIGYTVVYKKGITSDDMGEVYIDKWQINCNCPEELCDSIKSIYNNVPKSHVKSFKETAAIGTVLATVFVPYILLMIRASLNKPSIF